MKKGRISVIGICGESIFMKLDHFHEVGETVVTDNIHIEAGGKGVSMGRNVFQHENPSLLLQAVSKIVHEGTSVNEALAMLGEN